MKTLLCAIGGILAIAANAAEDALVLAREGEASAYSIVVPDAPSPCLRHSAEELSRYIKAMTGVTLPVVERANSHGAAIRLVSGAKLGRDSFRLGSKGNDFVIEGDDDRSVLFGVYDFLENQCGCEWLTPDQEIVPRREKVSVPRRMEVLRRPAFEIRENAYFAVEGQTDFCAKMKFNGYAFASEHGWKDIHGGRPPLAFDPKLSKCHTLTTLLPPEKYFKDHPEYYAEIDGKRRGEGRVQLCLTNPDVLRIVTSNLLARIARMYPEVKVFGVSQSDCWDYCRCPSCAAVDAREESQAGTVIEFVNAVADAVAERYPDVIVETLAYQYSRKPPKNARPRPNVMICLCTDTCDFSKPLRETRFRYRGDNDFVEDLKTWCGMAKYVHVWDYGLNFPYMLHAFPNIYSLKANFETFSDCGVKEIYEEGCSKRYQAGSALKCWLAGHLMWDPRQPLKPLLDRFYAAYYGAAAPWMRRYMEELHEMSMSRDEREFPLMMWGVIDSPALKTEFFERGARYMAKAAEAVKDDPVRLRNVQWEMNANDYTRIMRADDVAEGAYASTPHLEELRAAARRMLADWKAVPESGVVSLKKKIREESYRRIERFASLKLVPEKVGVSKSRYLDVMEAAVSAYSDEHVAAYLSDVERDGVQEHGFPRLAANLGVLVANGRAHGRRALLKRMMDVACRDAKMPMPPMSGGNDFSVKELAVALAALERANAYPKDVTDAWRAALCAIEAETAYRFGRLQVGEAVARNWVVFAAASEQARRAHGYGGNAAFVEKYVADQMRWFDANGMYMDPDQPVVYDLLTRLQFAAILWLGFDGPSRAGLEALMDRSAEPTLKMLSAAGEIPYGGRSNQFLHNNTFYAALCEWYAVRAASRGDRARAAEFRHAARRAMDALAPWLAASPVSHVKNRYPLALGKGVYDEQGDMGCERYAYFDKYMVTMGSWAMLGWLFADESIAADAPARPAAETFVTAPGFHFVFLRSGDYSAQFDYNADAHYDCDGLGRLHRAGAPTALCLSVPCAEKPSYRIERPNDAPLAIAPVVPDGTPYLLARAGTCGDVAEADWKVGALDWGVRLAETGLSTTLAGADAVALALPAFQFDGREETRIDATAKSLSVAYRGWRCVYELESDGEIADTGRAAANRNGRYRRFEARGTGRLSVHVSIERDGRAR